MIGHLPQLLRVGSDELLHLIDFHLEPKLDGLFRREVAPDNQKAPHLLLKCFHVLLHFLRGDFSRRGDAASMEDAASVGHLVLVGILRVVVEVDGMDDSQVEDHLVQN